MRADPRSDHVYVPALRDAKIILDRAVGISPEWREVLQGYRLGVLTPEQGCDYRLVQDLRAEVMNDYGTHPPVEPYNPEFRQFLTNAQIVALENGQPVILATYPERILKPLKQGEQKRTLTPLQHRYRVAFHVGVAQTLHTLGRLHKNLDQALTAQKQHVVPLAIQKLAPLGALKAMLPYWGDKYRTRSALEHKLELIQTRGDKNEERKYFGSARHLNELMIEEVRAVKQSDIRSGVGTTMHSVAARQFHEHIALGLCRCKEHDGKHTTAHREWSTDRLKGNSIQDHYRYEFMGSSRIELGVVDLMSIALFDMGDIQRVFLVHGEKAVYFEAAASLGSLFRRNLTRLDTDVVHLLLEVLKGYRECPMPGTREKDPMGPRQFLRYAMHRVGDVAWWDNALASPRARDGALYLHRDATYQPAQKVERQRVIEISEQLKNHEYFARLTEVARWRRFSVRLQKLPDQNRTWELLADRSTLAINVASCCRFAGAEFDRALESAIEAAVASMFHIDAWPHQTTDRSRPYYFRGNLIVAVASQSLLKKWLPHRCAEKDVAVQYYQKFLTDVEFKGCRTFAEALGRRLILETGPANPNRPKERTSNVARLSKLRLPKQEALPIAKALQTGAAAQNMEIVFQIGRRPKQSNAKRSRLR